MESQLLRTFIVAARTQNFRKAAEIRFLSQTTVTQQIRKLEGDLGVSLFDRNGRQVRLNTSGNRFLRYAEDILGLEESALAAARSHGVEDVLPLRVALTPYVGEFIVPSLLADFAQSRSDLPVSLTVRPSDEIPSLLREGQADVGLTRQRADGGVLVSELLTEEPFVLVAPEREGAGEGEWQGCIEHRVLLTHGPKALTQAVSAALDLWRLHPRTMEVQEIGIALALVRAGLGVSFVPRSAVSGEGRCDGMRPVPTGDLVLPHDSVWVVAPKTPRQEVQDLMDFLGRSLRLQDALRA